MLGWTEVLRHDTYLYIHYDLQNSPLHIRTNSVVGSDDQVQMFFYSPEVQLAGGVEFKFTSPPQYQIVWCTALTDFPTELPSETEKVWTIALAKASEGTRVVVNCNNKEVLNMVLSDATCSSDKSWRKNWDRNVERIVFSSCCDTASDYYRLGK